MSISFASLARAAVLAVATLAGASTAQAHEYKVGDIEIVHPWSRATPAGAKVAGGFLKIENDGGADRLVSIASTVADKVQIHEMSMAADGTASMQELTNGLDIPAKGAVELKPGSYHIMFIGLKQPLKEGESFLATLHFEKAGDVEVKFVVGPMGQTTIEHQGHGTAQ
ncbi:copper chaperone PCu(A)C [Zavarzinia sp.]|uniref:copper chaperone PCu(A)C n=1 Tax=Zavarzinia sp. TaxID=2027920 RepID=UPI003566992D